MKFAAVLPIVGSAMFLPGILLPFAYRPVISESHNAERMAPRSLEVIIPAYLERTTIAESTATIRAQLERHAAINFSICVVASDRDTAEAAAPHADRVVSTAPNGKASAVNIGVESSMADIIVLTDANCTLSPSNWVERLLEELDSAQLVSGQKTESGGREGIFWAIERVHKRHKGGLRATLAVVGEFMGFRRADYRAIDEQVLVDDLQIAMDFAKRGLDVTISSSIVTSERAALPREQWERRVRIAAGVYGEALPRLRELLRTASGRSFAVHKLYRLTVGAAGFWLVVLGSTLLVRPLSCLLIPAMVTASVLTYSGRLRVAGPITPFTTVIGMQAVPIFGAIRAIRRLGHRSGGWKKIAR